MIDTAITAHEGADKRSDRIEANRRAVRIWLGFVLFAILALVLVAARPVSPIPVCRSPNGNPSTAPSRR